MNEYVIVQDNNLVDAMSEEHYSAFELDFINYGIRTIGLRDEDFDTIVVNISELYEEAHGTKLTGKPRRKIFEKIKNLNKKNIVFQSKFEEDTTVVTNWFQWIEYKEGSGTFKVEFNEKLTNYLLQLKKKFTTIDSRVFILERGYTKRLYTLMKKIFNDVKERKFEIEELRKLLMIGDRYQDNYNFKKSVIEPAIEDINKLADFTLTYEEVKQGRKITHIKFIKHKKDKVEIEGKGEYKAPEFPVF